jgi:hypothetical protein
MAGNLRHSQAPWTVSCSGNFGCTVAVAAMPAGGTCMRHIPWRGPVHASAESLWPYPQLEGPAYDCMCGLGSPRNVSRAYALEFDIALWAVGGGALSPAPSHSLWTSPWKGGQQMSRSVRLPPSPTCDRGGRGRVAPRGSPGQPPAHRMAHGPFPAGALSTAAGMGCRPVSPSCPGRLHAPQPCLPPAFPAASSLHPYHAAQGRQGLPGLWEVLSHFSSFMRQ